MIILFCIAVDFWCLKYPTASYAFGGADSRIAVVICNRKAFKVGCRRFVLSLRARVVNGRRLIISAVVNCFLEVVLCLLHRQYDCNSMRTRGGILLCPSARISIHTFHYPYRIVYIQ